MPRVAVPMVGASGTPRGVIKLLEVDERLLPITFVAVTVNVYEVPLLKPVTVIGEVVPVAVMLEGDEVTV